jgi:hypothetical protein
MSAQLKIGHGLTGPDDEFLQAAFADWKRQHGYQTGIRIGDIDRKSLSQVLQRAQVLKVRARENDSRQAV